MSIPTLTTDVLVVGGGPTGLITSYFLLKAGLNILNIEQHKKEEQAMYGRACMLYGRSLELLDQMGLYDHIVDEGYITVTYNRYGEELDIRGWTFLQRALATVKSHFDFNIRQRVSENGFRRAIASLNSKAMHSPARLLDFSVDAGSEYPVLAEVLIAGAMTQVRSKYLIGADGGRSMVRSLARIPFPGSASGMKWIRIDAIVRSNMPSCRRGGVAIESSNHGNVLWTPTDNGRTRIGFVCPDQLYGENGEGVNGAVVMAEAKKAMYPFSLEFVKLDWWTVYAIGQRVAERFREGPVLLAGDACHTHSSGAGQGMNVGIHDASNLSWKLAGVLKGWYVDAVLDTYASERQASANHLIQLDKNISSLISGIIPKHFHAPPDADANEYLDKVFEESATFTLGFGVSYGENLLNQHNVMAPPSHLQVGHRAPDAAVFRPTMKHPKRLQELTSNEGKFWILIFPGGLDPESEQPRLRPSNIKMLNALRTYIESSSSFVNTLAPAFDFLTIVKGDEIFQTAETLGGVPIGRPVHDRTGEAYSTFGVDETAGAIVVLRPDWIVGLVAAMDQYETIGAYFRQFVRCRVEHRMQQMVSTVKVSTAALGEISLEGRIEERQKLS
ncbi:putative 2,4-dichlorophenol 6-monooxygenase [Hysterangium stoloniferum]|nr:putative 2,4-dichlorophenol 6-monooxygenase [Hysterangium stoloniferum]